LKGARACELASENLSHTRQEFSRMAYDLSKLGLRKRSLGTPEMEGVPELEAARVGEAARIGGCQNWRVPELKNARIGEGARIGERCQFWSKVKI